MTAPAWFSDDPDLFWTAFRYVAGELSLDAAAAFEAQLDGDQASREAVAAAVELSGAIALLGPEALPIRPRRKRLARAAVWVTTGIAAGLALGFGFDRFVLHPPAASLPRVAAEVVSTWSSLRHDREHAAEDALTDPLQLALNDDPTDLAATLALEGDDEGDVPSWMAELATLSAPDATPRGEN